jgi:hypothetical protein
VRVTGPDNDRDNDGVTTTIPGAHSIDAELSSIGQDPGLMYCRMPEQISLFTLIDISIITPGGELSEPLEIRLGELPKYISMAEQSGRAVLMTADGLDQADILEFLEKSK